MRDHVNNFDEVIIVRTKVIGYNQGACGFEYIQRAFEKDVTPFANTLKEYFQMFDYGLEKELKDMQAIFNQMETKVAKCSVDNKYFEIEKKQLIIENELLLEHIICQDVMNVVMHADVEFKNLIISEDLVHTTVNSLATINNYKNMEQSFVDEYNETLELKVELVKKNDMVEKAVYNELSN
ncbi:hypothetical protein Tco_0405416 [Tanacetum coccineum]